MTTIKQNSLTRVVPTRLTINDYDLLSDVARQNKSTTSALLRQLVMKCIEKQDKEIPPLD
ncbi:hypothetical protein [Anabaena sp. PCC 7108]|uniref:hypothetical protein n=1 Tax=Anabaena sp. PCC 7108 TaxID=163908 RepID=UPI000347B61E|nr:hypothetical protein [Anabaena sp. PCC 7108]